ncbi:TolC family protein [Segatella bryantii]|uniref:Transporter n=1 Tax=Segatella bryantii TaxID=77095 RepID=A0ABX4EHM2_SEGBR|nr:TolC family protein [Segatella bryantii]OYP53702.1 transporter [Segatella bryantii]UKK81742.1 TolC family protein [Segatella bryantii]
MNKKLISTMALTFAIILSANAQTRKMSMNELFELIGQNNKSIKASRSAAAAAIEGIKAAKSERLPDVNVQLSASYIGNAIMMDRDFSDWQNLDSPHWGNQFVVDAQQTIYTGGAITAGIKLAELGANQADIRVTQNVQDQRFIALSQYLELEKITHRERVLESNINLTQKLIDNIKEKQRQGVALKNDITRYELQMENLKLNRTKLQNNRKILNHQLCNTIGISTDEEIVLTDDIAGVIFNKEGEEHWQTAALGVNPQLAMAGVNEQMAKQRVKLAKSDMLPKVAVVAQNNFNGPITFELPPIDKNLNIWYVGIGVQYSLSSLFKSNKKISQAKLQSQAATEQKAVAAELLNNQIQAAYTNYLQSYVELETQQKSVQLAQENYQVVNDRYLNQLALITDMLDASNMKLDAELSEVDARINIAYAYYKMKYTAGNL